MIAIKDMEMPKSCTECLLLWEGKVTNRCRKNHKDVTDLPTRPDWCPLVEIVTCKDCKHWHDDGIMTTCDKNIGNGFPQDYFCGDGKRRE